MDIGQDLPGVWKRLVNVPSFFPRFDKRLLGNFQFKFKQTLIDRTQVAYIKVAIVYESSVCSRIRKNSGNIFRSVQFASEEHYCFGEVGVGDGVILQKFCRLLQKSVAQAIGREKPAVIARNIEVSVTSIDYRKQRF